MFAAIAAVVVGAAFVAGIRWIKRTPLEPMKMSCSQIDTSTYDYENDVEIPAA